MSEAYVTSARATNFQVRNAFSQGNGGRLLYRVGYNDVKELDIQILPCLRDVATDADVEEILNSGGLFGAAFDQTTIERAVFSFGLPSDYALDTPLLFRAYAAPNVRDEGRAVLSLTLGCYPIGTDEPMRPFPGSSADGSITFDATTRRGVNEAGIFSRVTLSPPASATYSFDSLGWQIHGTLRRQCNDPRDNLQGCCIVSRVSVLYQANSVGAHSERSNGRLRK